MNIKLLRMYIEYCNTNDIKPTFHGLKVWKKSYEELI